VSSLQASLLCCVAVVCLVGTAGALEQLAAGSTVVHVRVYAPPGFLRDKPEVFVRSGSRVLVTSNLDSNGLQVDRYGNFHASSQRKLPILTISFYKFCFALPWYLLCPLQLLKTADQRRRHNLSPPHPKIYSSDTFCH